MVSYVFYNFRSTPWGCFSVRSAATCLRGCGNVVGRGLSFSKLLVCLVAVLPLMVGCAIKPVPLDRGQLGRQVALDLGSMFAGEVSSAEPLTLEQALARAVHANLQQRVVALEGALALGLGDLAAHAMLPQVQASAAYVQRDRATYLTQDRFQTTSSLDAAWGVLDFGVSYISARQKSDGVLVAREQRRKAALDLFFEVETAFGQALVAQRLESSLEPLVIRINKALSNAREVERQGIQPAQESLDFQKKLLKVLDQFQRLQRQVSVSKLRLVELLNLGSGSCPRLQDLELKLPVDIRALPEEMGELEEFALVNRPELLERHYQSRIQADESRKALLRLLPGLEFSTGRRYDSSGVYVNRHWVENGVSLAWNLIKVVTGPEVMAQSRLEEAIEERRRLALAMTVMTQVRIAHLGLMESKVGYETALELSKVDRRMFEHAQAGRDVATMSEAQLIEIEADLLLQEARRDLAYVELSQAAGRLLVSLGLNRLPFGFDAMSTEDLTLALEEIVRRPAWATYAPAFLVQNSTETTKAEPTPQRGEGDGVESKPQGGDEGKISAPKGKIQFYEPEWIIESQDGLKEAVPLPTPALRKGSSSPLALDAGAGSDSAAVPAISDQGNGVGVLLRVGAYSVEENAQLLYSKLKEKNYPVVIKSFTDPAGRVIHQVSVGPVQGEGAANALLESLNSKEGLKAFPVAAPLLEGLAVVEKGRGGGES